MNLRHRHLLKLLDLDPTDLKRLVRITLTLKQLKAARQEQLPSDTRSVALLFEQDFREYRWAVQSASSGCGYDYHYFGPGETGLGPADSLPCNGRILGRLFDLLVVNGLDQENTEVLARHGVVPVLNLASHEFEPLGALALFATMAEHFSKPLEELSIAFMGDGNHRLARSVMVGASKLGLDVRFCGPKGLGPDENLTETCLALAAETGAQIRMFMEPEEALKGCEFVVTHPWVEGDDEEADPERVESLLPYRATSELLGQSGTRCQILHRFPLVLEEEPENEDEESLTRRFEVDGLEMSRELFDSSLNLSFDLAENQLHCCKALFTSLFS